MKLKITNATNYKELYEKSQRGEFLTYFLSEQNLLLPAPTVYDFTDVDRYVDNIEDEFNKLRPYILSAFKNPIADITIHAVPVQAKRGGMFGATTTSLKEGFVSESYIAIPFADYKDRSFLETRKVVRRIICHEAIHQIFNKSTERLVCIDIAKKMNIHYDHFRDITEFIAESFVCDSSRGLYYEHDGAQPEAYIGVRTERIKNVDLFIDFIKDIRGDSPYPYIDGDFMTKAISWYKKSILNQ